MTTDAKLKHARCLLAPQDLSHRTENGKTGRDLTSFEGTLKVAKQLVQIGCRLRIERF